ncbi:predicted protein [Uncinocarpus reesii 1704]|uniref:DUF4211 domain-containing protein n=1 Tax=Uncinocarpus reesii (strain UAMH 1704) TaxID=336963 RepID=C4JQH6_UNCRE|nr:uncharacterized protein UREG_03321 [Uncinocarpus reesii 1704]EEP78475.1 predicted protein [Uncinocarpus reesii 1704]
MGPRRQTRLNFTPLPPSSPGPTHSSAQGTDRFANIRYAPTSSSPLGSKTGVKREPLSSSPIPSRPIKQETSSGDEGEDDDEPVSLVTPAFRRRHTLSRRARVEAPSADEDEEEDDAVRVPASSRRTAKRPIFNDEETEDSDSDDIIGASPSKPTTKRRTRGSAAESVAKLKRKEQLEALRRRRAGERPKSLSPSESESSEDEVDRSLSISSDEDLPEDSDIEPAAPVDLDQYEDDFVLHDDDAELGAPADLVDMPFEFTRHRYKRLRDHFSDVVEWMVHNKLNPAFPREDPVYTVAFDKVNDEVMGVTGSQLVSSVWRPDFIRALEARPEIQVLPSIEVLSGLCDACNRSKHPAKFDVRFTGKPYSLATLEPIYDEEDSVTSDDVEEDDGPVDKDNINSQGHRIPDQSTHFYLGSVCKSNATMAHALIHWRFHLNEWVIGYLERKGVFSGEKILERERWSVRKRTRYANQVMDEMKALETDRLWRDFNLNLKTAKDQRVERRWR